jgi:hypothetical protein
VSEPHLDLGALRNTVASLEGGPGVVDDTAWFNKQSLIVQNTLMAGVIQNFEFVYELTYDQAKARQFQQEMLKFLGDARSVLTRLEARNG